MGIDYITQAQVKKRKSKTKAGRALQTFMPIPRQGQMGFLCRALYLENPGPCFSWNKECVGPGNMPIQSSYLRPCSGFLGTQNFLPKWLGAYTQGCTDFFIRSVLLSTNCASGMYTFMPENWSVHYYLCAMCEAQCEKNLDVQTKASMHVCKKSLFAIGQNQKQV